jgi:hypothetical protein
MLRYCEGAPGMLWASQVAPGNENNLRLRVYGECAALYGVSGKHRVAVVRHLSHCES